MDPSEMSPAQKRAHFERLANPPPPPKSKWAPTRECSTPETKYVRTDYKRGPPPKKSIADLP